MAASKKIDMTGDDDLLKDLVNFNSSKPVEKVEVKKTEPKKKDVKKSYLVNMGSDMSTALEAYCKKYDMTITAGIKKAVREMLEKV